MAALKPHPAGPGAEGTPRDTHTTHPRQPHRHLRHPGPVTPVGGRLREQEGPGSTHTRGGMEPTTDVTPHQVPPRGGEGAENAPLMTPMSPWVFPAAGRGVGYSGALRERSPDPNPPSGLPRPTPRDGGHAGMLRGRAPHRAPPPPGGERSPDRGSAPGPETGGGGGFPPPLLPRDPATGTGPAPSPALGTRPPGRSSRSVPLRRFPRSPHPQPGTGTVCPPVLPPPKSGDTPRGQGRARTTGRPPPAGPPPPHSPWRRVSRCPLRLAALYTGGAGRGLAAAHRVARDFPPAPAPPRDRPGPPSPGS